MLFSVVIISLLFAGVVEQIEHTFFILYRYIAIFKKKSVLQ